MALYLLIHPFGDLTSVYWQPNICWDTPLALGGCGEDGCPSRFQDAGGIDQSDKYRAAQGHIFSSNF